MEKIKKQVEELEGSVAAELARIAALQAQLEKERADFEERKEKIAKVHFASTIKLDVGGCIFKTSLDTLRKEDSMLSSMFSGRGFKVEKDEDGCYFIDRPGAPFKYILHYLQTGVFLPPSDAEKLKAVKLEVDFYQIPSLVKILKKPKFPFTTLQEYNGIVNWLGTDRGKRPFTNPVDTGIVRVTGDTTVPSRAVGVTVSGQDCGWCTNGTPGRSFTLELPIHVIPTSYCLSYSGNCCRPDNWKLSGSLTGNVWDDLKVHANEQGLDVASRANWAINTTKEYSRFRLTSSGSDRGGPTCFCFHVCSFEVYGEVSV